MNVLKNLEFYINESLCIDNFKTILDQCFPEALRHLVKLESLGRRRPKFDIECHEHIVYIDKQQLEETYYIETETDYDTYSILIVYVNTVDKHCKKVWSQDLDV
jgi:hypothetical protein